jgi:hypothetical protein
VNVPDETMPPFVPSQGTHHFVYLYWDLDGRAIYVGYGMSPERAISHASKSHNPKLQEFLQKGEYTLEIAGPFGTEDMGKAVETALISALRPKYNEAEGPAQWRFRPLGVPEAFAERVTMDPLTEGDLHQVGRAMDGGVSPYPILFVKIGSKTFADGREGYNLADPPSDEQILARMDRWWPLGCPAVTQWTVEPAQSPGLLVGVTGPAKNQIIIGAVYVDRYQWAAMDPVPGRDHKWRYPVPTQGPRDLDACQLRGRRISVEAKIPFSRIKIHHLVPRQQTDRIERKIRVRAAPTRTSFTLVGNEADRIVLL